MPQVLNLSSGGKMNKLLSVVVSLFIVGAVSAAPVTISSYTWDTPSDFLPDVLLRNGIDISDYTQIDVETWFARNADNWIIEEVAANANINSFGYYKAGDVNSKVQIFPGSASGGAFASVAISDPNPTEIGFYLDVAGNDIFFTEASLHGGLGQVAVFGNDSNQKEFILAWEDLSIANGIAKNYTKGLSDADYNDFIVKVRVPEPATLSFIGLSLLSLSGLSFLRRKQK